MGDFFRGWWKKVGMVTLMMAGVFTRFWLLSLISPNKVVFESSRTKDFVKRIVLRSEGGMMRYVESTELNFRNHDDEILFETFR